MEPLDAPPLDDQSARPAWADPVHHRRLWTPWRMRYVGGEAPKDGCVFCRRVAADDDVRSLILERGEHAFTIMNLYPYNTGHLMLVPNEHAASPEDVDLAALREMAETLPPTLRALRRALRCDGFNVGFNVGADAGAGVADHLHEHVVPRWEGDANFMPILAGTMVLPELIPVTYAKLRAELVRERSGIDRVTGVAIGDDRRVLAVPAGRAWRLPVVDADADESLWRAARRAVVSMVGENADVVGWAGSTRADDAAPPALTLRVASSRIEEAERTGIHRWVGVDELSVLEEDRPTVTTALARLDAVDAPP